VKLAAACAILASLPLAAASGNTWTLAESPHFRVYSQNGEAQARATAIWFEQLRAFFAQAADVSADDLNPHGPVRVIGFESAKQYEQFRLHPAADAYFLSTDAAEYIVMPVIGPEEFRVAAHEYAHLVQHSLGLHLPPWLAEGIAEIFSTVRIGMDGCRVGGDLPARADALRHRAWIPLPDLFAWPPGSIPQLNRDQAAVFYAESWALTDMLAFSPAYAPHFGELRSALASGDSGSGIVSRIYRKPLSAIAADLRIWLETSPARAAVLPGIPISNEHIEVKRLTVFESDLMLADLLLASGDLDRADSAYQKLANERPDNAAVAAALGSIAIRKGDRARARAEWQRAMQLGIQDAALCYRYAILADDANAAPDETAAALRRAIELKPGFDDARYKLGLLESNRGNYAAALEQFRAMRGVAPTRAYGYWIAMASALTETEQREEAKQAAGKAMNFASSPEERAAAARLIYIADTDLTVQLSEDENGKLQMITARKPHGSTDWNPFIEPADRIRNMDGRIRLVECASGKITGFKIVNSSTAAEVELQDPARVLITGGAPEFVCGAEDGRNVAIQYAEGSPGAATSGILRGMRFK
jgi:hypothetical protein